MSLLCVGAVVFDDDAAAVEWPDARNDILVDFTLNRMNRVVCMHNVSLWELLYNGAERQSLIVAIEANYWLKII